MSVAKLNAVHASLPPAKRGVEHVRRLRAGAGRRINPVEADRLRRILFREWKAFDPPARRALELVVASAAPDVRPIRFGKAKVYATGVAEQSALAYLGPKQGFVTVSDDSPAIHRLLFRRGGVRVDRLEPEYASLHGLEGCAYHAERRSLLVVSEDARWVWGIAVRLDGAVPWLGKPSKLGRLPAFGRRGNKGWEGLAFLEASGSPDGKAHLVAAHEGYPRGIGVFHPRTLALQGFAAIPEHPGQHPIDLSDLAVDRTGRLFVLSDESNAVFQMELRYGRISRDGAAEWGLIMVGRPTWLPGRRQHPKAEGICFDRRGDMWIACETRSMIFHLPRIGSAR